MQKHDDVYFAVKRLIPSSKCAPTLIKIVGSYEDGIKVAQARNRLAGFHESDGPYYVGTTRMAG
jgi:hypothetical protein